MCAIYSVDKHEKHYRLDIPLSYLRISFWNDTLLPWLTLIFFEHDCIILPLLVFHALRDFNWGGLTWRIHVSAADNHTGDQFPSVLKYHWRCWFLTSPTFSTACLLFPISFMCKGRSFVQQCSYNAIFYLKTSSFFLHVFIEANPNPSAKHAVALGWACWTIKILQYKASTFIKSVFLFRTPPLLLWVISYLLHHHPASVQFYTLLKPT